MSSSELSQRAAQVLQHAIEAYLTHGAAVSSSQLAQKISGRGLSPASIRARLSELEELGYLTQPHCSSGRIPTEQGLRLYIDRFTQPRLHPGDRRSINEVETALKPEDFTQQLARTLANQAGGVVCALVPRILGQRFKEIGIVRCAERHFACYFVSAHNHVQQKLVVLNQDLGAETVQRLQNYINELIQSRTLDEVRVFLDRAVHDARAQRDLLLTTAWAFWRAALPIERAFLAEGHRQLLGHADLRAHTESIECLLQAIEDKQALIELLEAATEDPTASKVVLSSEQASLKVNEIAWVLSPSSLAKAPKATIISVVGPRRMNYNRVIPMVGYAAEVLRNYYSEK